MTRLMTIGVDGANLRCIAQGFLSHYDWKDDGRIYIFGRSGNAVDILRNNPIMAFPILRQSLRCAKKMVRMIIGKNRSIIPNMSFLMITDSEEPNIQGFAQDIIPQDGHPMTRPQNRDWCVCDTYPDINGDRKLFLYNFQQNLRVDIGLYRRLFCDPDMTLKDDFLSGIDEKIRAIVSDDQLAFTRSGLHCDLHPRWSADGRWAVFDSIHEGMRQIYRVNVSHILE